MHRTARISALVLAVVAFSAAAPQPAARRSLHRLRLRELGAVRLVARPSLTVFHSARASSSGTSAGTSRAGFGAEAGWTFWRAGAERTSTRSRMTGNVPWATPAGRPTPGPRAAAARTGLHHCATARGPYCPERIDALGTTTPSPTPPSSGSGSAAAARRARTARSTEPPTLAKRRRSSSTTTLPPTVAHRRRNRSPSGNWRAGTQTVVADANDNTGIQALRAYVDGSVRADQPRPGCNVGRDCCRARTAAGRSSVDTTGLSDGPHRLIVEAVDTGGLATHPTNDDLRRQRRPRLAASARSRRRERRGERPTSSRSVGPTRPRRPRRSRRPSTGSARRAAPTRRMCVAGLGAANARELAQRRFSVPGARRLGRCASGCVDAAGNDSVGQRDRSSTTFGSIPTPPTASIAPPDAERPDANPGAGERRRLRGRRRRGRGPAQTARASGGRSPPQVVAGGLAATLDDSAAARRRLPDPRASGRRSRQRAEHPIARQRCRRGAHAAAADQDPARGRQGQARPRRYLARQRPKYRRSARRDEAARAVRPDDPAQRSADDSRSEPARGRAGRRVRAGPPARGAVDARRQRADVTDGSLRLQGAAWPEPARPVPYGGTATVRPRDLDRRAADPRLELASTSTAAASSTATTSSSAGTSAAARSRRRASSSSSRSTRGGRWRTFAQPRASATSGSLEPPLPLRVPSAATTASSSARACARKRAIRSTSERRAASMSPSAVSDRQEP